MNEEQQDQFQKLGDLLNQTSRDADDPVRRLAESFIADETFTHEQAEQDLPAYVMDELLERQVAHLYPDLHRHLLHCEQCADLHAELLADFITEAEPVDIPQPDLSFLPSSANKLVGLLMDVRVATRRAAEQIVNVEWPQLRDELIITERIFFRQIDKLGDSFVLQAGAAQALGFGAGEVLHTQRVLAASYRTNLALLEQARRLAPADEPTMHDAAQKAAEESAAEMGFHRDDQRRFAEIYVRWFIDQLAVS